MGSLLLLGDDKSDPITSVDDPINRGSLEHIAVILLMRRREDGPMELLQGVVRELVARGVGSRMRVSRGLRSRGGELLRLLLERANALGDLEERGFLLLCRALRGFFEGMERLLQGGEALLRAAAELVEMRLRGALELRQLRALVVLDRAGLSLHGARHLGSRVLPGVAA